MKKKTIVLLGVLALALILVLACVGMYNGLASDREAVDTAQSTISVQLQRRNDLIPNLVSTVKGYAAHETEAIEQVTTARANMMGAQTPADQAQASDQLSSALARLAVVVENYPDLKANENYVALQDELAGTENRIAVARRDYNEAVKNYNTQIVRFPKNLIAGMFGFEKADYFEAAAGAENVPQVDFN